jgi:hydrogenase expression/formation protein HypC
MKIKSINGEFAQVELGRLKRTINIQLLSSVKVGDYVIVHAGFAIQIIDPKRAQETLRLLDEPRTFFVFKPIFNSIRRGKDFTKGNKNK